MEIRQTALVALLATALLAGTAAAAPTGDAKKGEKVFARCKACHTIEEGGRNGYGPNLHGIVDRKAASVEKYKYSKAMREAGKKGLVWTAEELDKYLLKPRDVVPGTSMAFPGLPRENDRANVIAYLAAHGG